MEIWLPRPVQEVFGFFADASNLQELTPKWLYFTILTPPPLNIQKGTIIDYRLRIHWIPVYWRTEITAWEPPNRFVDEQRRGPYRQWIHEHRFEAHGTGTKMVDSVKYEVPGGWLVEKLLVRRDIERIFAFRREQLKRRFES
jgi:ligand-binding SRPBCC domain-containing protein